MLGLRKVAVACLAGAAWILPSVEGQTATDIDRIYASAVEYCAPPIAIEVKKFQLEYDATNNAISFDISASSVRNNTRPIIELTLTAYGIRAINVSINLCEELSGVLCPLPEYDFVGSATIPLPPAFKPSVPAIAYKIPDLQAVATVRLLSISDGAEVTCLTVDLSNGHTAQMDVVSWVLGALAVLCALTGAFGGLVALRKGRDAERGRRKERFLHLLTFFQFAASSGMLSVPYPLVFTAFTRNFAWAFGLIYARPLQVAIDTARDRTGGNLTVVAGSLVGGTSAIPLRRLAATSTATSFVSLMANVVSGAGEHGAGRLAKRAVDEAQEVLDAIPVDNVHPGMPVYATGLQISPLNVLFTVFLTFLLLIAVTIVLSVIVVPIYMLAISKRRLSPEEQGTGTRPLLLRLVRANAVRLLIVAWFPVMVTSFWQWIIDDAWLPVLLSVLLFLSVTVALAWIAFETLRFRRTFIHDRDDPASDPFGPRGQSVPLWSCWKGGRWWFFLVIGISTVLRAIFVGFLQKYGWVQTVALLVIEFLVFLLMCIFTPYSDKSLNGSRITVQITRVVVSALLVTLNESLKPRLSEFIRLGLAIGAVVVISLVVIGLFIEILIDLVAWTFVALRRPQLGSPPGKTPLEASRNASHDDVTLAGHATPTRSKANQSATALGTA